MGTGLMAHVETDVVPDKIELNNVQPKKIDPNESAETRRNRELNEKLKTELFIVIGQMET